MARHVLVATADHAMRKLVASVIREDGTDAIESLSGMHALAELHRARAACGVDAVVLDARRDRIATLRTLEEIRATDSTVGIVVLVKGAALDATIASCGAVPVAVPLTSRSLRETIASVRRRAPKERAVG